MRTLLAAVAVTAALLSACSSQPRMSARDAIDEFTAAGLAAPEPADVTAQACDIGCVEAVATDVVTVFRWKDSGDAATHAAQLRQPAYSLDEFVLAFPVGTDVDTAAYAQTLADAIADDDEI